jgi:uncharacterized protein (UPF0548 family)
VSRKPLADRTLTYPEVGATARRLPSGYEHLIVERVIGRGGTAYRTAVERLMSWRMHRAAGIDVGPSAQVVEGGRVMLRMGNRVVGVKAPCQVVYVIDDPRRAGFAYGTLEGHPERGEERFCVEWQLDDSVTLTITAFSRPSTWWARAASPITRRVQRRIVDRYVDAMGPSPAD